MSMLCSLLSLSLYDVAGQSSHFADILYLLSENTNNYLQFALSPKQRIEDGTRFWAIWSSHEVL